MVLNVLYDQCPAYDIETLELLKKLVIALSAGWTCVLSSSLKAAHDDIALLRRVRRILVEEPNREEFDAKAFLFDGGR